MFCMLSFFPSTYGHGTCPSSSELISRAPHVVGIQKTFCSREPSWDSASSQTRLQQMPVSSHTGPASAFIKINIAGTLPCSLFCLLSVVAFTLQLEELQQRPSTKAKIFTASPDIKKRQYLFSVSTGMLSSSQYPSFWWILSRKEWKVIEVVDFQGKILSILWKANDFCYSG